jgi:hypothetical protein
MVSIKAWPLSRILLVCLAWVLIWSALFVWPFIKAAQLAQVSAEHARIAALSFDIFSVLIRLAIVAVPPVVILGIWYAGKSK